MKLTKKQREEVVMLLRCAADRGWLSDAGMDLDLLSWPDHLSDPVYLAAWQCAWFKLNDLGFSSAGDEDSRRARYLEAALLIEEGWSP